VLRDQGMDRLADYGAAGYGDSILTIRAAAYL
jgi:hypothetical protein